MDRNGREAGSRGEHPQVAARLEAVGGQEPVALALDEDLVAFPAASTAGW
jgi:hypothetical protein